MAKKIIGFLLIFTMVVNLQTLLIYSAQNPSHEEIEEIIEQVAEKKNIPSVILKAIAWKESNYRQYDAKGNPLIVAGNIGIMQINQIHTRSRFDEEKLKNNIEYNIAAGADILLDGWSLAGSRIPTVGNMDRNILEHWYFPLWAYNGWLARNNPNVNPGRTYQESIFDLIQTKYGQPVTAIRASLLPKTGLPSGDLRIETPEIHHVYPPREREEIVVVSRSGGRELSFRDIAGHPKRQYIEALVKEGIVNGVGNNLFLPDNPVTREQLAKILVEAFNLESNEEAIAVRDWNRVSDWAREYMATVYDLEIIQGFEDATLRPQALVTREQALVILYRCLGEQEKTHSAIPFEDKGEISPWAIESIGYFYQLGVLSKDEKKIRAQDPITRGELSEWIFKVMPK